MSVTLPTPGETNWDVPLNGALTDLDSAITAIGNLTNAIPAIQARINGETFYRLVASNQASTNVKNKADYVCDGVADQVQIQAAVDAAFAEGGGIVQLTAGTFQTTSPITLHPLVTLVGAHGDQIMNPGQFVSASCIKPQSTFTGGAAIVLLDQTGGGYASTSSEQRISNLTIDGSTSAAAVHGIQGGGAITSVTIKDVTIRQVTGKGIYTFFQNSSQPFSWTFEGVLVDNSGAEGFHLINHTDFTMLDCISIGAGATGYLISNAPNSRMIGCRAEWSDANGIYLTGNFGTGQGSGGMLINACSTDRNANNGIIIDALGNGPVNIVGCMTRRDGRNNNVGGGGYAGIKVLNSTMPVVVSGWTNYVGVDDNGTGVDSPVFAASVTGSSSVQVDDSYLHGATSALNDDGTNTILRVGPNVVYATGVSSAPVRTVPSSASTGPNWFNVKDYGADGNGTTDDTASIQAAVNAASGVGGGVVYLPAGTYKLTSAITLHNRITIKGDGDFVTNIVQSSTTANGFIGSALIYIIIEDLRLTGPGTGSGSGLQFDTEFDYCLLRNMSTTNWGSTGIIIEQPIVSNLTRVTSFNNGGAGFYIHGNVSTGAGTSVSFNSCWAHDNISNGFSFQNMTYCALVACAADNQNQTAKSGYLVDGCTGFTFVGCGSEGNNFGWEFTGASTGMVITSPFVYATPATGIGVWVTGASTNVQIYAATEVLPDPAAAAFIKVDSGCSATIQGAVQTTANVLAANTTVIAANSSGTRSYPNGLSTSTFGATGNATVGGTLGVTGITTLTGALTLNAAGIVTTATSPAFKVTGTATGQQLFVASGNEATSYAYRALVTGDAFDRFATDVTGAITWGTGAAARDTTLHRTGVNSLQTDGAFAVGGSLTMNNNKILSLQNGSAASDAAAFGQIPTAGTGSTNYAAGNDSRILIPYNSEAQSQGLVQWNYDSEAASSTNTLTLGTIFMGKVYLAAGQTVTGLGFTVLTAGATLTYARAGLYNSGGTQVALSVDQSTNWTSTGYKTNTLSAPYVVPTSGFYWVGLLSTGTTAPICASSNGTQTTFNANTSGATLRHGTAGTGQTSLPGSITMSSMVSTGASLWLGLN